MTASTILLCRFAPEAQDCESASETLADRHMKQGVRSRRYGQTANDLGGENMNPLLTAIIFAGSAPNTAPDLSWLSGYWLSCDGGQEVTETWSDPRGGHLLGSSLTISAKGKVSFEQARIGPSAKGVSFFAQPSGQAPAEFWLTDNGPNMATFENPQHDFPQRIIYRRDGDRLFAQIEGPVGGKMEKITWSYSSAPLNQRCPK
jgi:hypothetical protein